MYSEHGGTLGSSSCAKAASTVSGARDSLENIDRVLEFNETEVKIGHDHRRMAAMA